MNRSRENYLETMLVLSKRYPNSVRAVDVANELGFAKASVSRAMSILKQDGLVRVDERGFLFLTEEGECIAKQIYEKHQVLMEFFKQCAKVDAETAERDACQVEHVISEETYKGIRTFLNEKAGKLSY